MKLEATNLSEGAQQIATLRKYAPYRFGGKWFIARLGNNVFAFRSKAPILRAMAKLGLTQCETAIFS